MGYPSLSAASGGLQGQLHDIQTQGDCKGESQ